MKKILLMFTVCILSFSIFTLNIKASESENNEYIENLIVLENTDAEHAIKFDSEIDNATYLVKKYENRVEIYDYLSGQLLNTMHIEKIVTFSNEIDSNINAEENMDNIIQTLASSYDKWGPRTFAYNTKLDIDSFSSTTVSRIAGAIAAWTGIPNAGSYASGLTDLAVNIYNNKYPSIYAKKYFSSNVYCPILMRNSFDFYSKSNYTGFIKTINNKPTWSTSPWDYAQPAACRVLAQEY